LRRIKSNSAKVAIGVPGDALDTMSFLGGFENPDLYEDTMEKIYADAKSDESLAYTLRHACLEENVAASFDFYLNSTVPAAAIELMSLLRSAAPAACIRWRKGLRAK
jgi:hypothetical protein